MERRDETLNRHARPRKLCGQATTVNNLMAAPPRHKYKVSKLLLGDVHREWRFGELLWRCDIGLMVKLEPLLLEELSSTGSVLRGSHEPKR